LTANSKDSSNTSSEIRLWHFVHEYPLATFSLPGGSGKSNSKYQSDHHHHKYNASRLSRTDSASRSARSLNIKSDKKRINLSQATSSGLSSKSTNPSLPSIQSGLSSKSNSNKAADYMTALKFNPFGNKLGGISQNGNLYLWHFNVPRSIFRREFRAYYSQHCHDKVGSDLVFVRGSSCIATAGESSNDQNVCIWDLLYNDSSRCLIRSYCCYEGTGANCIEHCGDIDSIVVGGHRGSLNMFDQRIPFPILKWDHGQSRIWKLEYHETKRQLLVGTLEGHISIWDVRKLYNRSTLNLKSNQQPTSTLNSNLKISSKPMNGNRSTPLQSAMIPFDDLTIPNINDQHRLSSTANQQKKGLDPLRKSNSAPNQENVAKDGDHNSGGIGVHHPSGNGSNAASSVHPTSISYASINNQGSSMKSLNLDADCIVNEWKLYSRKTFLNHQFGSASQLGYLASVGLTDAIWTPDGNILCSGSDGAVKYLRRKSNICL